MTTRVNNNMASNVRKKKIILNKFTIYNNIKNARIKKNYVCIYIRGRSQIMSATDNGRFFYFIFFSDKCHMNKVISNYCFTKTLSKSNNHK